MAGHSKKKENAKKQSKITMYIAAVLIVTAINIVYNAYSIYFKDLALSSSQISGFVVLTLMNLIAVYLLNVFSGSFFENYLIDFLGLTLAVELMINFHWKFWFLYLIYPCYFLYKGGVWLYEYVKTIGKDDGTVEPTRRPVSDKQKKKIIKVN